MSDTSTDVLPLFPLPMMPLPGEACLLHIFEPRYREMVSHCCLTPRKDGDFIIQYHSEERSAVYATAVRIVKVIHEHDDGRMEIMVRGTRRIHVDEVCRFHLYPSAKFHDLVDAAEDWDNEKANQVYALHRQLVVAVTGDEPADHFYEQRGGIAFKVAACSGVDMKTRLHLLKAETEDDRLVLVLNHLKATVPLIQNLLPKMHNIAGAFALHEKLDSRES